jgi:hypothetical protein
MSENTRWQKELIAALRLESLFNPAQLRFPSAQEAAALAPTRAESERAVANIRAWRKYLPEACVATMIQDGWQWST